jgi:hypothetical protein
LQWTVTDPVGATLPAAPPVIPNQIRASVYGTNECATVTVPPGLSTRYGLAGGTVTVKVTGWQAKTRNTAARAVVSPTGTSLKVMWPPGFTTSSSATSGTVS